MTNTYIKTYHSQLLLIMIIYTFFFSLKCEIHAFPLQHFSSQHQIFFLSKKSSILKLGLISFSTSAIEAVCIATTFSIIDFASIHASYPLNMSEASLVARAIEDTQSFVISREPSPSPLFLIG